MNFFHFMFLPQGQPWFTGAFWSNQTQWTIVTLPSIVFLLYRIEKRHRKHVRLLKESHENQMAFIKSQHSIQMDKLQSIHDHLNQDPEEEL